MKRTDMIAKVGQGYLVSNLETDEYSYVKAAGSKKKLQKLLGRQQKHETIDIRFENNGVVVLVETKQNFKNSDEEQLKEYVELEQAVHHSKKMVIAYGLDLTKI